VDFYSFSFAETKVAQADADSPKVVGVGVHLAFKTSDTQTLQTVDLHVLLPHDPERTMAAVEEEAYERARQVLVAAAELVGRQSAADLLAASAKRVIVENKSKG
jgi:hypothetical protein